MQKTSNLNSIAMLMCDTVARNPFFYYSSQSHLNNPRPVRTFRNLNLSLEISSNR